MIRLSLDRGRIVLDHGDKHVEPFLELEAELLPEQQESILEGLVADLRETWELAPASRSKFERALALLRQDVSLREDGC